MSACFEVYHGSDVCDGGFSDVNSDGNGDGCGRSSDCECIIDDDGDVNTDVDDDCVNDDDVSVCDGLYISVPSLSRPATKVDPRVLRNIVCRLDVQCQSSDKARLSHMRTSSGLGNWIVF